MQDTGTMQLVSDDVVNEALESDHLALQNMSGSKYVQVLLSCMLHTAHYQAYEPYKP